MEDDIIWDSIEDIFIPSSNIDETDDIILGDSIWPKEENEEYCHEIITMSVVMTLANPKRQYNVHACFLFLNNGLPLGQTQHMLKILLLLNNRAKTQFRI